MKLTVVRHGETVENVNEIVQGQSDGTLTNKGIEQAKELANKLKNKQFDYIYSSDLGRCKDTAKYIAMFHQKTPFELTQGLREYSFGSYHGRPSSEIDWGNMPGNIYTRKPGGGDSLLEGRKRVLEFLKVVYSQHPNDKVLFITHGGPMRIIRQYLLNRPLIELREFWIENCGILELNVTAPINTKDPHYENE